MNNHYTPFKPPAKFWQNAWLSLLQLIANGLIKSGMVVGSYFLIKNLSRAIKHQQFISVWSLTLLLVIALTLVLLRMHERYNSEKMSQKYINRVRSTLLKRIMRASIRSVQERTIGNLSSRLAGDLNAVKRWLSLGIARLVTHTIFLLIVLGFIFSINSKLGLAMTGVVAILIAVAMIIGQSLKKTIKDVRRNRIRIHSFLVERLASISTIRAMGKELVEIRKVKRQADRLEKNIAIQGVKLGMLRGVGDASGFVLIAVLFSYNFVSQNSLSVQEITALISLVLFLNSPIRELGRVLEYYQGAKLSLMKLEDLFAIPRIIRGKSRQQKMLQTNGTISLKNITLKGVFKRLNFQAKAGEHIAIIGKNGSGKSTLINLLLGLVQVDAGTVLINNIEPKKMMAKDKAQHIGVSGVNLTIIRGSLLRNLTYRHKNYQQKDFDDLLKLCQLTDLIEKLPDGLATRIKENGNNFSSGEKARISLFRALLGAPGILVLDEPESYLDKIGLVMIQDLLKNYDGTILIATHHAKLINLCDKQWNLSPKINNNISHLNHYEKS